MPRGAAIAVVLGSFLLAIAGFALLVLPDLIRDVVGVLRELPAHVRQSLERAEPFLAKQGIQLPHSADEWIEKLQANTDKLSAVPLSPIGALLKSAIGGTFSAIGAALAALIVPILAVYLLAEFDNITAGIRDLVPLRWRDTVIGYAREIDLVLSQFMRGQLTVMGILAVLYGGSYAALGIRLAVPIGIAAGVLNIVPYVGSAFALVAGLLMAVLGGGGWVQVIGVIVAYAVVQTLEGFVITPRVVGESVGLKEVWVLLALFVGGEIFGFLGVLLAVPMAAVLKIFVTRAVKHYRASATYLTPAVAGPGAVPEPPEEPVPETADAEPPSEEPAEEQAPPSEKEESATPPSKRNPPE